jgi:hypothetical protein
MHRATKSELTESADGSMARRAKAVALYHYGRHVDLDRMCLLMEVRCTRPRISSLNRGIDLAYDSVLYSASRTALVGINTGYAATCSMTSPEMGYAAVT